MKRIISHLSVLLLVLSLLLSACAQTAPQPQPAEPGPSEPEAPAPAEVKETTAIIGFTASQTGSLNVESIRQINGLNLWMKHVNEAGGVQLADVSKVKFESRFYDDESNKDRVQELYTRLATEDNATFMISPYSSGLADASAVIAEQYGKILITTGAASDSTYQKSYTLVYQAYTPASKYLTGAVDLLRDTDPSVKRIAIVHENDKFSTDVSTALNEYALAQGYEVVLFEGYDSATTDFGPFINKIQQTTPDAIMGGGHFQDGTTFAKQLFEKKVPVKFAAILVAPPEPTFAELGDAAIGIIGPSQWEPLAAFTQQAAQEAGIEWYGLTGEEFVNDYQTSYSEEPSYHSAGGYIAGLILQKAIEQAGTLDTQAVKAALDSMDILTFFGHINFDTSPENHGLQRGHSMVYIQWTKNSAGELEKQVVWPAEGKTASVLYPIR
jgi:ABC-type branched-subunit amino acid transport system substrate-binding protein